MGSDVDCAFMPQSMFVESLGGDLGGKLLGLLPVWAVHLVDLLYAKFVLINLMGCMWLFTAYSEGLSTRTWLDDVGVTSTLPLFSLLLK
jgi:hypothetical protein